MSTGRIAVTVGAAVMLLVSAISSVSRAQADSPVIDARLLTAISSTTPGVTVVRAMTITSPLAVAPAAPAGCELTGTATVDSALERQRQRVALRVAFSTVVDSAGKSHPLRTRLIDVDNAREDVTSDGVIIGVEPLSAVPSKRESLLMALAYAHPFLLATAEGVRLARREAVHPGITYSPGTELRLAVEGDAPVPSIDCRPRLIPTPAGAGLEALAQQWPLRTTTAAPDREADWINMAFVGSRQEIARAFESAGWLTADRNSMRADVRTFLAVAADRGYQSGPVSRLLLKGVDPAMVYQKQNNTFAKRHHIRIWSTTEPLSGEPVWLAAATHDIGIEFSRDGDHFTHRIDGAIDDEREKVVGDLAMADVIADLTLVSRPSVPRDSRNAAGDAVTTDGRVAVVTLKPATR